MATPAVRASGLVERFESTIAVDHVDLELHPGEVRGLLGPNGAGKTTLLRMLFGLVAPDAGSIELFGRPPRGSDQFALEGVAGFVEDPSFYPYLSGRANLELLAELDGEGARHRIDGVLERVDLLGRAGDRLSGYSSGMRQRLGIAASLMRDPRLLLLDEPTSGLDPAGAREVGSLLRELSSQGVAVLLSSHLIGEIESTCDCYTSWPAVASCGAAAPRNCGHRRRRRPICFAPATTSARLRSPSSIPSSAATATTGVVSVYRTERRKLAAQLVPRVMALACLLGPFAFAAMMQSQSAEDRDGTWKMILTRSCRRRDLFVGKALAAATFSVALIALLAVSSLAAGLVFVGAQPLVGLGGKLLAPGTCVALVLAGYLSSVLPMLGFASLAMLLSAATRNGIAGVLGTILVALVM